MDYNYINNIASNIIQPKYSCFCGCKMNYSSIKKHLRSNKHKMLVKAKLFDDLIVKLNPGTETS